MFSSLNIQVKNVTGMGGKIIASALAGFRSDNQHTTYSTAKKNFPGIPAPLQGNDSKRRSERAGKMEMPGAPDFKVRINTLFFQND